MITSTCKKGQRNTAPVPRKTHPGPTPPVYLSPGADSAQESQHSFLSGYGPSLRILLNTATGCPYQSASNDMINETHVCGSPTKGYSVPLGGARVIKVSGNNKIGHKRRLEARLPVSHFLLPCLPSPQPLLSQEKPVRNPLAFRQSWSNYYL